MFALLGICVGAHILVRHAQLAEDTARHRVRTRSRLTCFFSELCQIKFVSVFVWYSAARGACLRCS